MVHVMEPEEIISRREADAKRRATSLMLSGSVDQYEYQRLMEAARPDAEEWYRRYIPASLRNQVLASGPCAYCGDPNPMQVDHIVPLAQGGDSRRENLAPACKPCNMEKLDFTPEEWRAWREEEGLGWPPKSKFEQLKEIKREMGAAAAGDREPDSLSTWARGILVLVIFVTAVWLSFEALSGWPS